MALMVAVVAGSDTFRRTVLSDNLRIVPAVGVDTVLLQTATAVRDWVLFLQRHGIGLILRGLFIQ